MNLFDLISVSTVHQRALQIEKQLERRSGGGLLTSTGGVSRATSNSGPGQRASDSGLVQCAPPTMTLTNRANTSGVKCFGCGETGHRQVDCKK